MMITVRLLKPPIDKTVVVNSKEITIKGLLGLSGVNYHQYPASLDGATLGVDDYDKTLDEYGVTAEKCNIDFSKKMDGLR